MGVQRWSVGFVCLSQLLLGVVALFPANFLLSEPMTQMPIASSINDSAVDGSSMVELAKGGRDDEVEALRDQVASLSAQLEIALQQQYPRPERRSNHKRPYHPLSPHAFNVREVRTSSDKRAITAQREKLGRTASIATRQVLDNLPDSDVIGNPPVIQRILDMFQRPSHHMEYLNSEQFCKDIMKLANKIKGMFEREPRVVYLQSPAYVFGDIHGNLEDLHFFSDNIWRLGMSLTAGSFLFLGDYVDRGLHCLECVAYLFAMKLQLPNKVYLLRGNHETRDINGWEEHYGERSFMYQCRKRFGDSAGYRVWYVELRGRFRFLSNFDVDDLMDVSWQLQGSL